VETEEDVDEILGAMEQGEIADRYLLS
jgi:hypothetical protein